MADTLLWQQHAPDQWRFGRMVRGVVRKPYYAEIYYDEDHNPGWRWFVTPPCQDARGACNSFDAALEQAECVLRNAGLIAD